jgi:hypothetical protein
MLTKFFTMIIKKQDLQKIMGYYWFTRERNNGKNFYPMTILNGREVNISKFGVEYHIKKMNDFSLSTCDYKLDDTSYYKLNKCWVRWYINQDGELKIEVLLSKGLSTIIDVENAEIVTQHVWYTHVSRGTLYYAVNKDVGRMHRLLLPGYDEIDHKDGNGLNNTIENLRGLDKGSTENQNNKRLNFTNTTGVNGLYLNRNSYVVSWSECKKRKNVCFSISKYGSKEEAFKAAKKYADDVHERIGNHNGRERFSEYEKRTKKQKTESS